MTPTRATVRRDQHGIPHLEATSVTDLAHAQGRVVAEDRAWQLDLERRRGEGRVAELLGPAGVTWDVFARRARLAETAQAAHRRLTPETRAFVDAYVDGVNAAFADGAGAIELADLGVVPGEWQPWTPLAVFWVQHVLFGSFPGQLWRHHVARTVGEEALALFRTEGVLGGSNAFGVAGGRTASGSPVVAGDPHRLVEAPNVYLQVRLVCTGGGDDFDVAGFAFPGVPGVQHFAHAGDVAWAITNGLADTHHLYVEELRRSGDAVEARTGTGWEPASRRVASIAVRDGAPVDVEVVETPRGPVVVGGPEEAEAVSLRTPPHVLADLGFETLLPLLRSRTVADVEAAWEHWVDPVNNVVAADRSGRVVHFVAGRVPEAASRLRTLPGDGSAGHGWTGWVTELPHRVADPDGYVVTANQRATPEHARIGDDFAAPFRAERIAELLADEPSLTAATAASVLTDDRQLAGGLLLDLVADTDGLTDAGAALRDRLRDWDRRMTPGSRDAARFAAVRDEVVARVCGAPALAPLREPCPYGELYQPWFALPGRVAVSLHVILATERPFGLDTHALVREAVEAAAERGEDGATWGDRHRFHPLHGLEELGHAPPPLPSTPLAGDADCVLATSPVPGTPFVGRAPTARYVWDLADRAAGGWVVPLGASGDPRSPHHTDQHTAWARGALVPIEPPTEETP